MAEVTSRNVKYNVMKAGNFFLTRIIINKLSTNSKVVFQKNKRLSKYKYIEN